MLRSPDHKTRRRARAVTLVELLVALAVLAILSTAVATLLAGAGNTHQYVNTETDTMSQVENAYRRILHNARTASAVTSPSNGTLFTPNSGTPFQLSTQVDPNNGNVAATVKYYLKNGNLMETDSRYTSGGNAIEFTLLSSVSTFTVQRVNTSPMQLQITIVSGTTPAITRTAIITCRNL